MAGDFESLLERFRRVQPMDEDAVKSAVKAHLEANGYKVLRVAWGREHGKDIDALRGDEHLWVTAKGFPAGTERTDPRTQARHYFAQAIFDVVTWRSESEQALICVALPDRPTYRNLAEKASWLQKTAPFKLLWVNNEGGVTAEV